MRVFSLDVRQAMNAEDTAIVPVILATFNNQNLTEPVRVSSDATELLSDDPEVLGTTSRKNEFLYIAMSVLIPDDKDDAPQGAQVVIENVSADIIAQFRSAVGDITVDFELVFSRGVAGDTDFVEEIWPNLRVVSVNYDEKQIVTQCMDDLLTSEPQPSQRMTRSRFPALFR